MLAAHLARFRKAYAALAAGVAVFLASGLITGSLAVWISTGVAAAGAALGVAVAPKNTDPKPRDAGVAVVEVLVVVVLVVVLILLFHGRIR